MSDSHHIRDERVVLRTLLDLADGLQAQGIKPADPTPNQRVTADLRFFRRSNGRVLGLSAKFAVRTPETEDVNDDNNDPVDQLMRELETLQGTVATLSATLAEITATLVQVTATLVQLVEPEDAAPEV